MIFERVSQLKSRCDRLKWEVDYLKKQVESSEKSLAEAKRLLEVYKDSSTAVLMAVKDTHKSLETSVVDIVNKALKVVFDEPYEMSLKVTQRGSISKTTSINIVLSKNGVELEKGLLESVEGGVLSVISIILRIAFLMLKSDQRRILLLDEALGALSRTVGDSGESNLEKSARMLEKLSDMFGIQMVIVSHTGVGQ